MKQRSSLKSTGILAFTILTVFLAVWPANGTAKSAAFESLNYVTEQYPPFNYRENGRLQGIAVDLLETLLKKADAGFDRERVRLTTWTSGYRSALRNRNTVLFVTTRTPEREKRFQWVGPIAPTRIVVIARKDRSLKIHSLEDLRKLKIAALRDDVGEDLLVRAGFQRKEITSRTKAEDVIHLLETGKVDAWAYEETAGLWLIKHRAADPGNFASVYRLYEGQLYYAFNRRTPKEIVRTLQQILENLKEEKAEDGYSVYEKIFDRYLKPRYVKDRTSDGQVVEMVDRTASDLAADAFGTIRRINAGEHPYHDRDNRAFYVFVYDPDVTMVAHGDNIRTVGESFRGKTDVNGKAFRDEIVARALKDGSGWEDYVYTNPGESGLFHKTTFFRAVKGSDGRTYIVCSGKFKAR